MRFKNQLPLTLLTLFISISLSAKKGDKVPGYIIDNDGKRTEGKVIICSITDNEVKVVFIDYKKGKKVTYKPKQLSSYGYQETDIDDMGIKIKRWVHYDRFKVDYPPKIFASTTVFMEREVTGALSLYCYYIEVRDNPKQPYRYFYYLKNGDGELEKVERDDFAKVANSVFKDYTALNSRVGKKDFEYRNMDRMVRDYNYWMVNQHNTDEYRVAMKNNDE